MNKSKISILFLTLLASLAFGPAKSAADPLSVAAQQSLEPSHQRLEGFEPGQHPGFAYLFANKRVVSKHLNSMTPEQRQVLREQRGNMTQQEREAARQKVPAQSQASSRSNRSSMRAQPFSARA